MSHPDEPTAPIPPDGPTAPIPAQPEPPTAPIPPQPQPPTAHYYRQPPVNPFPPVQPTFIVGPRAGEPPHYPPPPYTPYAPPRPAAQKSNTTKVVLITLGAIFGGLVLMCLVFGMIGVIADSNARADMKVTVDSCQYNDVLRRAEIGFSVTNTGDSTRSAWLDIEYRDGSGKRLDSDTSHVRSIAAGDTARGTESTYLDAPPNGTIECKITGIR